MQMNLKKIAGAILLIAAFHSCVQLESKNNDLLKPSKVELKKVDGNYHFFVNGELYEVKGVGGSYDLAMLKKSGGNTFRTWGTHQAKELLDSAQRYDFMVAMGLSMRKELHNFNYDDTAAVSKQFEKIKKDIDSLKHHPNILCWVAGNELNLMSGGKAVNPKVYDALKQVVDYIHETDPNHPVTTAFAGVNKTHIDVAMERCPDLDFISLQVYGSLLTIEESAKEAEITKPYLITEFGPVGHWERPSTSWGREIEETSSEKAKGLQNRMQKAFISNKSGLCLGGYAFVWGYKQERTPTWYGMFIKTGESTEVVDELTKFWNGKYPENRAPQIEKFELNGKKAINNIFLEAGKEYTAKVFASDPNNDSLTYAWETLSEVKVRSHGGGREIRPDNVEVKIISSENGTFTFIAPPIPSEYRIFVYVYDGKNKVGTANIPYCTK
jgi:hypothetical protein